MALNKQWMAYAACFAGFVALGIAGTILGPAYQSLTAQFSLPLESGGIFTGAHFAGMVLSVIFVGRLLDRMNARYLLMTSVILMGGGLILVSLVQSLPLALLSIFVVGLGYGALTISANLVVAALSGAKATQALNLLNMFYGFGAMASPQLVNFAVARNQISLAFMIGGCVALPLALPMWLVSVRPQSSGTLTAGKRPPLPWLALLPFGVVLFAYVGSEVGYSSWLVTQMTKVAGSTTATATFATSLFWLGMTIGRIAATFLLRHLSDESLLMIVLVIVSGGVGLILLLPTSESIALMSALIVGLGCGPIFPTTLAIANKRFPEARGASAGVLIALSGCGAVILPWLQGQIGAGRDGGMILPLIGALVMFIVVTMMIRVQVRK